MAKIITIGHLTASSKESRDRLLKAFETIAAYSKSSEPGVSIYAITVPVDDQDDRSIYMIEEYADQQTYDMHLASGAVQDLIALMTKEPVLVGGPVIYQLEPIYSFKKSAAAHHTNPYIVFANLDYKLNTAAQSLPYWKDVASTSEQESGTLTYALCREQPGGNQDALHTIEVYESERYLWDVHAKSSAIVTSIEQTKDLRINLKLAFLRMVGGYFHKS